MQAALGSPAFYVTYAVIQAALVLLVIRYLDTYDRQPLGLVALVAAWGATGAAAISLAGNELITGMLTGDATVVFGDAIAPPFVEEAAKGLALLAAVGPVRRLARRAGMTLFEGVGAGVVYGAAIGLGFGFTEDVYYLTELARTQGFEAGFDVFVYRRDFLGPAAVHHAIFTATFGAGFGLAAVRPERSAKIGLPLVGFAMAVFLHAVNNGLVQAVLVLRYGLVETAAWQEGVPMVAGIEDTAATVGRMMRVLDVYYLFAFVGVMALWNRRQRRLIMRELEDEERTGLLVRDEWRPLFEPPGWLARSWRLISTGQLERWRHLGALRSELARLALLKGRTRRSGGDRSRVQRARRRVATLATFDVAPSSLPVPANPLIGREQEMAELSSLLSRPDVRLVTLTGPGGTGKTRLAIELASCERDRFSAGVFLVELVSVTQDLVPTAIAEALGVEISGDDVLDTLADYLQDKQLLLVLDNFEHVADAAPVVGRILAAAARIKIVATSRRPLRVEGEQAFPVPPLRLPVEGARVEDLAEVAAVSLFVERARGVDPGFSLDGRNAEAVAEICVRLDGLPLAIELAAARTNVLSPETMSARLAERLQLLSPSGSAPSRHQTMRAAIDWSHALLDPGHRTLFARLAVFVDGLTLEAAEAVVAEPDGEADVLDGLASLLDDSLLRRLPAFDGHSRFGMLETIREYALERLAERDELDELRQRHARYFAELAEEAEPELAGPQQVVWVRRLEQETGNLRAALEWSLSSGGLELGLRIAGALPRFWSMRALTDVCRWLEIALAAGGEVAPEIRKKALFAHGYGTLNEDYLRARRSFEEALRISQQLGDDRGTAACLAQLGWISMTQGELEEATRLCQESLDLAGRIRDHHMEALVHATLGDVAVQRGAHDHAVAEYERSLGIRRRLGDRRTVANTLLSLGRLAFVTGDDERARTLLEEALVLSRELDDAWGLSVGLGTLGRLALRRGGVDKALALLREALELSKQRGAKRMTSECLDGMAQAAAMVGEHARAAHLSGAAEALREAIGSSLTPAERSLRDDILVPVRLALGDRQFQAQWEVGLGLRIHDAVTYALVKPAAGPTSH